MNILLYADIPGLPEYVLLTRKAVTVPAIGDRPSSPGKCWKKRPPAIALNATKGQKA